VNDRTTMQPEPAWCCMGVGIAGKQHALKEDDAGVPDGGRTPRRGSSSIFAAIGSMRNMRTAPVDRLDPVPPLSPGWAERHG
jgi:hypothetical protein